MVSWESLKSENDTKNCYQENPRNTQEITWRALWRSARELRIKAARKGSAFYGRKSEIERDLSPRARHRLHQRRHVAGSIEQKSRAGASGRDLEYIRFSAQGQRYRSGISPDSKRSHRPARTQAGEHSMSERTRQPPQGILSTKRTARSAVGA